MFIGTTVRNMGEQSTPELVKACALICENSAVDGKACIESIWVTDHIAIPPDDAEGSGGRYLDTLTTLSWLAGLTERVKLGSGVLILPYRAALPVAKQIATLQELSAGRLLLGVGIGWMDAEFRALGIDRHKRGAASDAVLEFLRTCFSNDVVTLNGQAFIFKPRPIKPPVLIGGRAPHALERAVALGDGWMPMARQPAQISDDVREYRALCAAAKRAGSVTVMTGLPLNDLDITVQSLQEYQAMGVDRLVCAITYDSAEQYQDCVNKLLAACSKANVF
jgi:probable F420-dependent oxidoreductase